ncbi:J domain-containing protein [Salinilacihabitans rarus]|uniref:J domain-containing protein n=1 Tax=Salinilacihabitans rarus TaxID=2961596 RepID=UPI0020C84DD2|nr:J domain-containing protein [Salinilacihabitans rarus]
MAVADERREGCDGCGRVVSLEELTTVTMPDGDSVACCPSCAPHAREAARKLSSLDQRRGDCDGCTRTVPRTDLEDVVLPDGTVVTVCPRCLSEVPGRSSEAKAGTGAGSDSPAEAEARCSQCREPVAGEPFRVRTIDDRTEELCRSCKEAAEERGVVADVAMQAAEAREILGVDADATDREIREAFLTQIKHAHPDRKSGSRSAFKLVKDAYDRLS